MKAKMAKKDKSEIYECGYVHKVTIKEKLNPMNLIQKGMSAAVTDDSNSDLGKAAISVFYQAHQHPQDIIKYFTKTPGWETCGDAVYVGFTNKSGVGLSSTDGQVTVDGTNVENAGYGTYYHGFSPDKRGSKKVKITSTNGNEVNIDVKPAESLEIISVDGKGKDEEIVIDGSKDIRIELKNGDADPKSNLHVQLLGSITGTRVIYDIIVTKARNSIYIPKEAFKNYEGSPAPLPEVNTLIVNRVSEKIIENTDAGAIRTIEAYMDWLPVTMAGDIAKGSIVTAGFDESKNTKIDIDVTTEGAYTFLVDKSQPFNSPPIKLMKKVAVASFVVRGNLLDTKTTVSSSTYSTTITKMEKWFPEMSETTWKNLAEKLYNEFRESLKSEFAMEILPLDQVVNSAAYQHAKPIQDGVAKTFVEVGAGNTKRILTSSSVDFWNDLSITFGSDFVSERLIKELNVDAVLAVTFDLNFNFETEGLDPKVSIVAFAPNVSYKTSAKYFSMNASTLSKPLDESRNYTGGEENVIYQMIKADTFNKEFVNMLKKLSAAEDKIPLYEKLWQAKF